MKQEISVRPYRMSESGMCPKALSAKILEYEPVKDSNEEGLEYYSELEHVAALILAKKGYDLRYAGTCLLCPNNTSGHHVEIKTTLLDLVGHLDRQVNIKDVWYPVEIKCLGRFSFDKFLKEGFAAFPNYAAQEACYLEAEKKPGIYVVLNRDTGKLNIYEIPYNGEILGMFPILKLGITYDEIIEKLNLVELDIRDSVLSSATYEAYKCRYCSFRYLCIDEKIEVPKEETLPSLLEAAEVWKEGKIYERMGDDRIEQAKSVFLQHAKEVPKFTTGGVSVNYLGSRQRRYLSEEKLKRLVSPEILEQGYQEAKEYDDIRIREIK